MLETLMAYWWVVPIVLFFILYKWTFRLFGIVIVPEDRVGLVNKKFVLFGKNKTLPDGAVMALNGEAGYQADTLAPGLHWGYWPWQYKVELDEFTVIPDGKLGVVVAADGVAIKPGRVLAKHVDCNSFQDARAFIMNGGERGPQITIIPPGTYRINNWLFNVEITKVSEIPEDKIGIVTTKEGNPLQSGEIAGRTIDGHDGFQNAQLFVDNGGQKGLQEQVLLAGKYFINPYFASIELDDLTIVPIAHAGVVISYVGDSGKDVTGDSFKHGNLVRRGERGVWVEPLDPGKYPINKITHKVELVPTANVVLNWATGKNEAHKLDERLSTITVRSTDGFQFNLDVSQIIHVPRAAAPKVIARFGDMKNLVTQVLEPIIGNYFRNAAQKSDVIDFLKSRAERQTEARNHIEQALTIYDVQAVDTLIGDIVPPDQLMKTLTDRKLAEQERITYKTQQEAQVTRQELEKATALAEIQKDVVAAERGVQIAEYKSQQVMKAAEGEATAKTTNAAADAKVVSLVGTAEAERIRAIGTSEAEVIKLKVESIGSTSYTGIEISKALAGSGFKLVPEVVAGGSGNSGIVDSLMALMLKDTLTEKSEQ